jgi:Spy/CpxP family protein refolding chaperone
MTGITAKRLTQLSASLLTAGVLLVPSLALANATTGTNAPSAIAMSAETQPSTEFRKMRKMLQPLNLSAEQQTAVDTAVNGVKADATSIHEQMKANKDKLKAQQFADQYNAKDTETVAAAQGDLVKQMIILRTKLDREVYAILTPEQRTQLRADMTAKADRKAQGRAGKGEKQPKPE